MTKLLSWIGDNIGTQTGSPITIELQDSTGQHIHASVATTLSLLDRIKEDERHRILSALRRSAERSELNAADIHAYRAWEQDQAAIVGRDQSSAALDVNKVTCLLHTLQWAAKKCEDAHDFEQFHALALELFPRLGATLEHAAADLGQVRTGLFEEARHGC